MAGIYIAYPFCAQKCTFCNFASGVSSSDVRTRYMQSLFTEIGNATLTFTPDTLYFGGGTPSNLSHSELNRIFHLLPYNFRETTIEAAPGTLTSERVRHWASLGINRVSLGVQSFVDRELRRTGRRHNAQTVTNDVHLLRSEGITNINIDLIAGLPGQTEETWRESLNHLATLDPPHVSVYIFEIDDGSRLGAEVVQGGSRYGANELPDEDLTAQLYETAVDFLAAKGIERYEISNFARPGYRSLHNLKYWQLAPYAGFGVDAHSFDGSSRTSNPDSVEAYITRTLPLEPEPSHPNERFWVGLRLLEGIEPSVEEWRTHDAPIQRLVRSGLLERSGASLRLTKRGVLLSNEVFEEFIAA